VSGISKATEGELSGLLFPASIPFLFCPRSFKNHFAICASEAVCAARTFKKEWMSLQLLSSPVLEFSDSPNYSVTSSNEAKG
jgi:hypothetical protein